MRTSKILHNLNRGFLLSVAILLCVVIFLILQGRADDKLEPELKAIAEDFIADSDTVVILPEEYRVLGENPGEFQDNYMDYMQIIEDSASKDNQFYSDNPELREYSLSWLQNCAGSQISNQTYITSIKSEITKFNSFSVYKGKATLAYDVLCTGEMLTAAGTEALAFQGTDTLTFERENGKWVITNYQTSRFDYIFYGMNTEVNVW
jgi:hypothetical protein